MRFAGSRPRVLFILLQMDIVQEELKLTSDQKDKIEALRGEARPSQPTMDASESQKLSGKEWVERNNEINRQAREYSQSRDQRITTSLPTILSPDQLERLGQIRLQAVGTAALAEPEVQKSLALTAKQKREILLLRAQRQTVPTPIRTRMSRRERDEARNAAQHETDESLLKILTPDQKDEFEKMKGKKIAINTI